MPFGRGLRIAREAMSVVNDFDGNCVVRVRELNGDGSRCACFSALVTASRTICTT
jgi:hypothetical protein